LANLVLFARDSFQVTFPLEASPTIHSLDGSILQNPDSIEVDRSGVVKIRLRSRGEASQDIEVTLGKLLQVRDKLHLLPIDYIIAHPTPTFFQRITGAARVLTETEEDRERRERAEKLKLEALACFTLPITQERERAQLRPMRSSDPREGKNLTQPVATVYLCADGQLRLFNSRGKEYTFKERDYQYNPLLLYITDPRYSAGNEVSFCRSTYSIPKGFYGPLSGAFKATTTNE
jgi:hypothetical protein